jgi:hypothetical protein
MNEFLARFANKPISEKVSTEEPSFFSSKPKPVVNPSRKKAFTVRFGVEGDSSSGSSSSSNSDSDSDSDSESGSQKKAKIPKTRKTKAKAAANKAFIVDKTGTEDIDIHEFISAIQRGTGVQIGKPHLAGSFCTLNPKPNTKPSAVAAAAEVRSTLETFQIRKLGFTIELKMADFASVHVDEPLSGTEKPGKKKRGEKEGNQGKEGKQGKDKGAAAVQRRAAPHTAEIDLAVSDIVDKLNKMRSAPPMLTASNYYMNNRKYFLTFINEMFQRVANKSAATKSKASSSSSSSSSSSAEVEAQIEAEEFDCSDLSALDKKPFSALYHQRIVREYMNAYSPYRGLLLFHGLGSGKTCSSIVIAEGLSTHKKVIVMTPASLQKNYIEEIKKCGDAMFKLDQHWVFFPLDKVPKGRTASEHEKALLQALGFPSKISPDENVVKINGGVWFAEHGKPGNYHQLDELKKMEIDSQIDRMIRNKYRFINYNGIRLAAWRELMRQSPTGNYFDDAVIIVDEAHNLVSRVVNKIKSPKSLSMQIYNAFLSANNAKVVLLTGTPIINYPNELGIMFNMLRGYISTFNFTLDLTRFKGASASTTTLSALKQMFDGAKDSDGVTVHDYLDFKQSPNPTLTLTRNPFGFVSHRGSGTGARDYASVSMSLTEGGNVSDAAFIKNVVEFLKQRNIGVTDTKVVQYKALPDRLETFNELFIKPDGGGILNPDMFSRRIIGLTSYFRSAQEKLLPRYDPKTDFQLVEIEMTNHQFNLYKEIRENERKTESNAKRRKALATGTGNANDLYGETSSTYRIFSRACCNFAFPDQIPRPLQIDDDKGKDKKQDQDSDTSSSSSSSDESDPDLADDMKKKDLKSKQTPKQKPKQKQRRLVTEKAFEGEMDNDDGDEGVEKDKDDDEPRSSTPSLSPDELRTYNGRIKSTIEKLADNAEEYLSLDALSTMYSPKFAQIYREITDEEHVGLHLLYSQFRTLEGVGIFKLVMDANKYAEFKVRKNPKDGTWEQYYQNPDDEGKPMYALYTGTESKEEKEIVRNVFNSSWSNLPNTLKSDLMSKHSPERKNKYGDVIKLLMITASGAEGINLRNVRYVHIMEPYWHPVRTEQIIGRANRICSHYELPEKLRTVNVFVYIMKFTEEQLNPTKQDKQISNIKVLDSGITTDQKLLDTSSKKQLINQQLLTVVKASAVDCATHKSKGGLDVQCFHYKGTTGKDDMAFVPDIYQEQTDANAQRNQVKEVRARPFNYKVTKPDGSVIMENYLLDQETNTVYNKSLVKIGTLVQNATGARIVET